MQLNYNLENNMFALSTLKTGFKSHKTPNHLKMASAQIVKPCLYTADIFFNQCKNKQIRVNHIMGILVSGLH